MKTSPFSLSPTLSSIKVSELVHSHARETVCVCLHSPLYKDMLQKRGISFSFLFRKTDYGHGCIEIEGDRGKKEGDGQMDG